MATTNTIYNMPMDEIFAAMLNQLNDEIDDSNNYYKMAKAAGCDCQAGCDKDEKKSIANGLWEISLEEYTHAKFLHTKLIRSCITIPDAVEHKYQALKSRAEEMYEPKIRARISNVIRDGFELAT